MDFRKDRTLLFRADASVSMGTGHVMRCLALAQAWQDQGGHCTFLTAAAKPLLERLRDEGFEVRALEQPFPQPADLDITRKTLAEQPGCWLVLDGYHFDSAYQQALRACGARLLVIDDEGHLPVYHADIILNQNLHADTVNYSAAGAQKLLGTRFALLRREFSQWRDWQRPVADRARKILVTMGGADPDNVTGKVIQAFDLLGGEGWEAKIVVGAANPHLTVLEDATRKCRFPVQLVRAVRDMPALMAWADIAVSAAGSTCWELCFMGLPSVLIELAGNQTAPAKALIERGVAVNAGWHEGLQSAFLVKHVQGLGDNFDQHKAMALAGRKLVDGFGSGRVIESIRAKGLALKVRRACEEDCRAIWEWANDPITRAVSLSSDPILWEKHVAWYGNKLQNPACYLYVVTDSDHKAIGMVRYDCQGEEAVVSINIAPTSRGHGLGSLAIRISAGRFFAEAPIKTVIAIIKDDNLASITAFERAGYRRLEECAGEGSNVSRFRLDREDYQP